MGLRFGIALALALIVLLVRYYDARNVNAYIRMQKHPAVVAAKPAYPAAPDSSWLIFSTTDPDTRIRMNHARLRAEVPVDPAKPSPALTGAYLEVRSAGHGDGEAVVVLASLPAAKCSTIDHVAVAFDTRAPEELAAAPSLADAGCSVKIDGYDRFVQGLLNAQTLVVTPKMPGGALQDVAFHVSGLTWDGD